MSLGDNILRLRKKKGLSQEQLGEEIDVTRQTISNWELGETSPNPEQLKALSSVLNVSIDELLDNDIKSVIEEKVSNTEKLAGIIIKILKVVGIGLGVLFIIDLVAFIIFLASGRKLISSSTDNIEMVCSIDNNDYVIDIGSDSYYNCSNCKADMQKDIKELIDYSDLDNTSNKISSYFKEKNGICR